MRILLALVLLCLQASAHDWYPRSCCKDGDCHPIDCAELKRLTAGDPSWKTNILQSQDEHCHICQSEYGWMNRRTGEYKIALVTVCIFMPVETN